MPKSVNCVELHVRRQRATVLVEESHQAADMIEMAMADDQSVDLLHVDAHDAHVGDKHVRRVAVIKHQGAGLVPALGFEPERQPPLGVNHIGKPRLEGNRLHAYSVDPCGAQEKIVVESTSTLIDSLSTIGTSIGAAEANSTHVKPPPTTAPARAAEPARKSRRPNMRVMSASIPCLEAARESKLKFTSQVRPNRLKSVDARDQRDRQQFHEAKIFDAVPAPAFTG